MSFLKDKDGRIVGSRSTTQSVAGAARIFERYRNSKPETPPEWDPVLGCPAEEWKPQPMPEPDQKVEMTPERRTEILAAWQEIQQILGENAAQKIEAKRSAFEQEDCERHRES